MSISGAGTQESPYILDTYADFNIVNTMANVGKYAKFNDSSLIVNMLDISKSGHQSFTLYVNLDANGCTFLNMYLTGTLTLEGTLSNLNLLNFCYVGTDASVFTVNSSILNLTATGAIHTSSDTSLFKIASDSYVAQSNMKIKATTASFYILADSNSSLIQTQIEVAASCQSTVGIAPVDAEPKIQSCKFSGRMYAPTVSTMFINSSTFSLNVYDITIPQVVSISEDSNIVEASIYNNEKMTVTTASDNIIGCSSDQMIDSEYLRQHGFAMAY